ncbi:MAG TPA: dockerin type I domain-containing protein, partial [Candidatus Acidoferrum sp.]
VSPTSPFGTNCSTPMLVGNPPVATNPPIFCQFEFDITTAVDLTKKVDTAISGRTKQFNDVVIAFPPANVGNLTVTMAPTSGTVIAGNPLSFVTTVTNSAGGAVSAATLTDALPAGTNVSWSISPAYSGPGTCAITGATGSQVLNCVFGTIAASQTFNISLLSSNSSIGTYANTAVVQIGNQQILSIGTIVAQAIPEVFSGLTASQSIQAGTTSIALSGTIGNGTAHPAPGETVSILINGVTHNATFGTNGTFSITFPTATIPASSSPYLITYSYAGDAIFSPATNSSTSLTVLGAPTTFPLTVKPIGTGNGTVTDNFEQINCTTTAGVQSGTCSANYNSGTVVTLTATPSSPSTFAGWGSPCSGTGSCSVTMTSPQTVTASFTPPPQLINLSFTPGSNQSGMATYDCPSNPAPSPSNPCTDPNAHALALAIPQVLQPFSLTVQASEVPPSVADGVCPNGGTPTTDFDCRFVTFFTYQTLANGNKIVPLCFPYANGNCVHYQVFSGSPGVEPNPSFYVGPIDWVISFNNDTFIPPAPYTGSTPRMYDDPDYAVSPTSPFGTNCSTPMLVGNPPVATNPPIFCQFEFDITTAVDLTKKVDTAISGRTKQFNDVVIALPPANVGNLTVTTTTTPSTGIVTTGSPLNLTIAVTNSAGGPVTGATLSDPLPAGTNVSWSISPAYSGPGTCAITGAIGTQMLNCSFATIAASQAFNISLLSSNSSLGKYTSTAVIQIGNQQILTVGSIIVTVPGDVNGDGVVNCTDLNIVKASFNKKTGQPGFDPRADVNHDGIVNILDLAFVARQIPAGTTCQ